MATSSPTTSRKSRAHRDDHDDRTTTDLTVDELRDVRTDYFSKSPNDRVQKSTKQSSRDSSSKNKSHRRKSSASRDFIQDRKESSLTEGVTRRKHSKKVDSDGNYVYKARHTSERDRDTSSRHTAHVERTRSDAATGDQHRHSHPDVSQSKPSARQQSHRRASHSRTEQEPPKPVLKRRDTVSATSSKTDNQRKSALSSWFKSGPTTADKTRERTTECLTCGSDDIPITRSAKLRCGHRMCNSCLKRIFTMSVNDPAHMPPRCCTNEHIPLKYVDHLFDTKFRVLWNRKYEEYTTKNRLYCPQPGCGTWIKPSQIRNDRGRKYGVCTKCKAKVCPRCNEVHRRQECPKDPETEKFLSTAQEQGWQRCPSCKAMVELKEGCHHITCRCTAEWCFLCTKKWRTCECPWFNYTGVPDGDRLNHMRIPAIIPLIQRHVFGQQEADIPEEQPQPQNDRNPALRYQQQADARRRQMDRDEAFARQLELIAQRDDVPAPRQNIEQEVFGNAGEHFLNNDFVQESPVVNTAVLGDAAFGQRGERASGRRRAPKIGHSDPLGPNAFGTESLLGLGPPAQPAAPRGGDTMRKASDRPAKSGGDLIGRWLSKLG